MVCVIPIGGQNFQGFRNFNNSGQTEVELLIIHTHHRSYSVRRLSIQSPSKLPTENKLHCVLPPVATINLLRSGFTSGERRREVERHLRCTTNPCRQQTKRNPDMTRIAFYNQAITRHYDCTSNRHVRERWIFEQRQSRRPERVTIHRSVGRALRKLPHIVGSSHRQHAPILKELEAGHA